VYLVAHRGGTESGYEEQTTQAYSFAAKYSLVLEGDIRFTSDGVIVISHDSVYDGRSSDVTISNTRWSYLRDTFYTNEGNKVCTLGALLRIASSKSRHVSLEFKTTPTNDQIRKVKAELTKYNLIGRSRIFSFDPDIITKIRKIGGIRTGLNVDDNPNINQIKACGGSVALNIAKSNSIDVRNLRAAGIEVQLYTTNTDDEDRRAIAMRPDAIITDRPYRTSRLLLASV
jgi:glycerophosphoryl diester phosphodiesterase